MTKREFGHTHSSKEGHNWLCYRTCGILHLRPYTDSWSFQLGWHLLGQRSLTCANGFTGNGPDIGILHLDMDGCLEHLLEDLVLVSGRARLQLAVVREMGATAIKEARIEAIHKGMANVDGKLLLVDEQMRGSNNLSTLVGDQRKYCIATGTLVCLLDMVESSVRLLGITGAELVEEEIQDRWGGQIDNVQADLSFNGCRICLYTC